MLTFFKKNKFIILLSILTLFFVICNFCVLSFCSNTSFLFNQKNMEVELLGDRGGSHMPELGFHLTLETKSIIIISVIAFVCLIGIITLIYLKNKRNKKLNDDKKLNNNQNIELNK